MAAHFGPVPGVVYALYIIACGISLIFFFIYLYQYWVSIPSKHKSSKTNPP